MHLRYKNGPKNTQKTKTKLPKKRLNICLIHFVSVSKILEQDKYSLQKEVELKARMLESLQSDFDYMKNQQVQQVQEQQQNLERIHSTALSELNGKVEQHIHSTYP